MIPSELQRRIRDAARAFAQKEIVPHAAQWDRDCTVPIEVLRAMGPLGLMGMCVAPEWGGAGADLVSYALATEEIAAGDCGLCNMMCVNNSPNCAMLVDHGTDAQKERFLRPLASGRQSSAFLLTEPQAGSDASALITRAVKKGDRYVIDGTKQFITMALRADYIILFAVTGVDQTPRGPQKRITSFLVDKDSPGITVTPLDVLSNRGMKSCIISFDGVRVPARNILGVEGGGFAIAKNWIFSGRVMLAANCVGLAERAMGYAARWANTRVAFGRTIGEFQGTSFKLADMATEIHATRLMVFDAAAKMDDGTITQREASQVNLFGSEMVGRVTDNALQIMGGMGITKDMPLERFWRDARVERVWEGTSEIHRDIIAKDVLREFRS